MTHSFITETKPPISPEELRYREPPDLATLKLLDVANIVFAILYAVPASLVGTMEEQRLLNLESGEFEKSAESKEISAVNEHNKSEDEVKTALDPRNRDCNQTTRKIYMWYIHFNLVYVVLWPILFYVRGLWGHERLAFVF
ncbi:hypothetical protein HYALB_00010450 [Hymenoscyphus albidus]|uniref:Uncharacterized protein n=1 Tax=Hymenoscyphus albidus TaxID=595503 RepID=A0A9N9LJU6_9HELO|nr:hypothetical protein HYALB_00010450 [Hymenoscyphus albidus]